MQIPSAVEEVVGSKWAHEDVMPLNGTPAEVQELREKVMQQRAAIRASKDKKKGAKISAAAVEAAIASAAVESNGSKAAADGAHEASNGELILPQTLGYLKVSLDCSESLLCNPT